MIARVYALHERQIDEEFGIPSRTATGSMIQQANSILRTASITMKHPAGLFPYVTIEVAFDVLGGNPQIGDEFEVHFERKRK